MDAEQKQFPAKCDPDEHVVLCECHDEQTVNHCTGCNELLDADADNLGPYRCYQCRVVAERDEAQTALVQLDANFASLQSENKGLRNALLNVEGSYEAMEQERDNWRARHDQLVLDVRVLGEQLAREKQHADRAHEAANELGAELDAERARLSTLVGELASALEGARRECSYACVASRPNRGDDVCTCGADSHNARITEALAKVKP